ncbi:putative membrane protein YccC [Mesorhizobium soli]|uniref:FUSC family protein n=1 Tax=Pseudaminobacter soli (ex Li et al. 2025) TaxID=1295366 RepID=UPI002473887C|nr:FUSC family protein [Mesorhizobium soli]MDH6234613.1 putative membrane protein YccC [Mesorhizobium soli]
MSLALAGMLGLEKAYWVPVSCLAVMQGVTLQASWSRNVHRIVGTVLGMGLTWLLLPFLTNSWAIALAVTLLTLLIETAVVRHYAFAAIFITPLTILLAESSSPGPVSSAMLMQTRLIDTVVGALIGLVGAVCLHNRKVRRIAERGLATIKPRRSRR